MSAIVKLLFISAALVIPWGIVLIADLEIKVIALLKPLLGNDLVLLSLMLLPPIGLFIIKWLLEPRGQPGRKYSGNKNIVIKFRG
jgi:hypothetical protein